MRSIGAARLVARLALRIVCRWSVVNCLDTKLLEALEVVPHGL